VLVILVFDDREVQNRIISSNDTTVPKNCGAPPVPQ
jgi:hypothetical protein